MELVFASNNDHKIQEIQALLGAEITIKSLKDIGCEDDIPETGYTFAENAQQKSDYVVSRYGKNCFADDSGLMVDALNGAPGVYSARYSGSRNADENITLLLRNLQGNTNRKACFKTVICLHLNEKNHFFEGAVTGSITSERRGDDGFGYNPIFIPDGYEKTFSQMTLSERLSINHRAIAIRKLIEFLKKNEN